MSKMVARTKHLFLKTKGKRQQQAGEGVITDSNAYLDMFRKFGSDLGLLKFDVEKLLETQRRNLDALGQSAKALEAGLRQATSLAREYKPPDIPAAKGQRENKSRRAA